ncbi:hypothetical protein PGTUg99_011835 [Puccinia graminis f. sp. tritici]|uniref:Uncharacterized protein n=1 Tax=Puccinia graminis f. sp. tritici TaxID=56615 RepID=A0A5B0P2A0_PUCGR|nr:hypothetical protein PGTUg99_011835 [Puccinia graminis f. sp. tritici]
MQFSIWLNLSVCMLIQAKGDKQQHYDSFPCSDPAKPHGVCTIESAHNSWTLAAPSVVKPYLFVCKEENWPIWPSGNALPGQRVRACCTEVAYEPVVERYGKQTYKAHYNIVCKPVDGAGPLPP